MTLSLVLALLLGVIAAHVAVPLASRKVNLLFLLAGFFLLFSPLSGAPSLSVVTVTKLARIYTTLMIVLVGLLRFQINRFGPALKAMMLFVALSVVAPLWSNYAFWGLLYKAIFAFTFTAGAFLAYGVRDREEMMRGIHFLVVLTGAGAVLALAFFRPQIDIQVARLDILEMNPNRIGGNAASLFLLCSYIALYDHTKSWKAFAWFICGLLGAMIVLTGSRAAAALAVVGFLVEALPLSVRPGRLFATVVVVTTLGYVGMYFVGSSMGASRLASLDNSRAVQWATDIEFIKTAPVVGHGWAYVATLARANMHSIYLQTAAEMGVMGVLVLAGCLLYVAYRGYLAYLVMQQRRAFSDLSLLALSLLVGVLFLGVFETSPLMGTTPDTLLFGFAIGLIDRLPELGIYERRRALLRARYESTARPAS